MQARYSFWTGRKKELAQKPVEEEAYIHARMIESSMYRYISDIDCGESKNSAAYRVL